MTFRLSPEALRAGHRLVAFDTIGSTNVEALERARVGEAGPFWIVARRQTDGRGRRGSAWQTPDGNLAATLLLTTNLPPATIAQLGFVAGMALVRALDGSREKVARASPPPCGEGLGVGVVPLGRTVPSTSDGQLDADDHHPGRALRDSTLPARGRAGASPFSLKWPNDVLCGGAKLAGILLGSEEVGPGHRAVAIGIGVNVAAEPDELPYPATSLARLGHQVDAELLFDVLSATVVEAIGVWDHGRRFDAVRRLWLARAAGLGQPVAIRTGAGIVSGTFDTIDDRGQLVLRDRQGRATFVSAGEVHFGIAASAAMEAVA